MNTQNELQRHAARCQAVYPPGTRVILMAMGDVTRFRLKQAQGARSRP